MDYTHAQESAIAHRRGNLLILACAGSGKTEVISRRIAELVHERVPRSSIVAFTFTERASAELRARVRRHLEETSPEDPSIGDLYVGTIHRFCLQLLKEVDAQYRNYEVMDEARQAALIVSHFNYHPDTDSGIGLNLLRARTKRGGFWETVRVFVTTLGVIHQRGINLEKIRDEDLRNAIERYRRIACGHPNYFLDFDQIVELLIDRLKSDSASLRRLRERIQYLVVDEYQDVDDRQEELISLLSGCGRDAWVTAVGDDDQSIYRWRGARIENILRFAERYPSVTEIKLEDNFRSTHAIVDIANSAIGQILHGRRFAKQMIARQWSGTKLTEAMTTKGEIQVRTFANEEKEAKWVADQIEILRGTYVREKNGTERAIDYGDMAILLRSVRSSGKIFVRVLDARGIPVVVKGVAGLFDHDEVLLLYASFCLLARIDMLVPGEDERLDEVAIRQKIRSSISSIRGRGGMPGADGVRYLGWIARKREELDRRNLSKASRGRLARRIYPQDIFQDMLGQLDAASGRTQEQQKILFNLGRFSALITEFEAVHQWVTPKDITGLCFFLGGWAAAQVDEGRLDEGSTLNAVQVMTVHASKGLEWPVVFIPRVSSSNFPSSFRNRGPVTFLSPKLFNPTDYADGDEGERRLWYVAVTRCRQFLSITSPDRERKRPTEFLREIKHDRVERDGAFKQDTKGIPSPPAGTDLLPTTYTDLSYYWRCQFEYELRALMRFSPGVRESYGYGQQIHNVLAEAHLSAMSGKPLSKDETAALLEKRFHLRYTKDGTTFKPLTALREAAKKSIVKYLEQFPASDRFVLDAEKPFEFVDKTSGALISGTIDLLERVELSPSGEHRVPVAIIDFKTHRWRDIEAFQRARHDVENQLRLYAIAARGALGLDVQRAQAHFLSPVSPSAELLKRGAKECIEVDISQLQQEVMSSGVSLAVQGIRESLSSQKFAFSGSRNGHCPRCDFRQFCPGFREWDTSDRVKPRPDAPEVDRESELRLIMEDLDAGEKPK